MRYVSDHSDRADYYYVYDTKSEEYQEMSSAEIISCCEEIFGCINGVFMDSDGNWCIVPRSELVEKVRKYQVRNLALGKLEIRYLEKGNEVIADECLSKASVIKVASFCHAISPACFRSADAEEIHLPDSVMALSRSMTQVLQGAEKDKVAGEVCFNAKLRRIRLSNNLRVIPSSCFRGCTHLEHIEVPDGVKTLGYRAFENCRDMAYCTLPDSLEAIREGCFAGSGLRSISIPDNVRQIPEDAFRGCSLMKEIKFPKSLVAVGSYAFDGGKMLPSKIELPENCRVFGARAFASSGVKSLTITAKDECHIDRDCFNGSDLEELTILSKMIYPRYDSFDNITKGKVVNLRDEAWHNMNYEARNALSQNFTRIEIIRD